MKATALIAGSATDGPGAALMTLASGLGFARVLPYAGAASLERCAARTPLCFVFCPAVPDISELRPVAESIRFAASRKVRFSPLIYVAENPSLEETRRCIALGFDDVIAMPFTRARFLERIRRQIGTELVYYETPDYFGPDRGQRLVPSDGPPQAFAGRFRRLEITRHLETGVTVLRDDLQRSA